MGRIKCWGKLNFTPSFYTKYVKKDITSLVLCMNGLFKIVLWFYLKYNKLDRSGTDQTSIKGPVKISYNKFVSNLDKQEDTMLNTLC